MNNKILKIFNEISNIPRCSGNETEISNFILKQADKFGLYAIRDNYNNVKVKKNAQGMIGEPLILQSHMDMVCVAENDYNHNFLKDPIELIEDNGWIKANRTSLGSDNGIGMAMMITLMEDESAVHPDLEFLFTSDEERGLAGASNIDLSEFKGKTMLNLDGEEEGVFYVSCAGAVRAILKYTPLLAQNNNLFITKQINIRNCNGGHSGLDIKNQNANPIKLIARVLNTIDSINMYLHEIKGGDKENSIPTYAYAIVSFPANEESKILEKINELECIFKKEYPQENNLEILIESTYKRDYNLTHNDKHMLINLLLTLPNGVMKYDLRTNSPSLSNNIGLLEFSNDIFTITNLLRSNENSTKAVLLKNIEILSNTFNCDFSTRSDYPAWEYSNNSPIRDKIKIVYKYLTGKEADFQSIHAGLECAYFAKKRPDLDIISLGCNIKFAHTTKERFEIESAHRVYDFLLELIK